MTGLRQTVVRLAWVSAVLPLVSSHVPHFASKETQLWWDLGQNEVASALNVRHNWNVAKNVIMFLGDGMGITANTAARIYKGQKNGMNGEEGYLTWERFPTAALLKTYNIDKQVPDSAATATAYLSGVKANSRTLGVNSAVEFGDCAASKNSENHVSSILQWAQDAGMSTGIVTTTRVTHATPAALYAHSPHRNWECDGKLGEDGAGCKDIADQLINDSPGKNVKVILGGGRQALGAGLDPASNGTTCTRQDDRNLAHEWLAHKTAGGHTAKYITTAEDLKKVDTKNTDYLLGLFADSHMPFVVELEEGQTEVPSLEEMALKAIEMLKKSKEGFFLLVEGGRIDHGLHKNSPHRAVEEAVAMDRAVAAALKEVDLEETLVLVTADHSHVLTINGYPDRGNDILGITGKESNVDGLNYTTLMFTTGPGFNYSTENMTVTRHDVTLMDTRDLEYKSVAAVPMTSETHGGEDVAVWATGPMAHLFHRTHEQNYVAHVMAYAACVGPSQSKCERPKTATFTKKGTSLRSVLAGQQKVDHTSVPWYNRETSKFPTAVDPDLQEQLDEKERKILKWLGQQARSSPWSEDLLE
ncbi:alkaline phosphatase-like [Panulirus ornatus]|uniref:alkaline phosphatase-like n=1 Tax=Panulirus ornatus TaxID=150431 RepID=UPI003A89A819